MGMVMIHESTISRNVRRLRALKPLANPTPRRAPTKLCVVETGIPRLEASKIVQAAPNSAQKPRVGVSTVILRPIVSITLQPQVARPITIPTPPKARMCHGVLPKEALMPSFKTEKIAERGPTALATSLAP